MTVHEINGSQIMVVTLCIAISKRRHECPSRRQIKQKLVLILVLVKSTYFYATSLAAELPGNLPINVHGFPIALSNQSLIKRKASGRVLRSKLYAKKKIELYCHTMIHIDTGSRVAIG